MSNLFDDFEFEDDEPAPAPDWLRDLDDEQPRGETSAAAATPTPAPAPGIDLDRLREKSTRAGAMEGDISADAPMPMEEDSSGGNFFSRMTPAQRLIIAVFFVVDVCLVGVSLLLVLQVI